MQLGGRPLAKVCLMPWFKPQHAKEGKKGEEKKGEGKRNTKNPAVVGVVKETKKTFVQT